MERPAWPYVLGAIGAAGFALGCFFLYLLLDTGAAKGVGQYAFLTLALGSMLLGIGWIGLLQQQQAGFGPIGGSFAVTLALGYAYLHRNDWSMFKASGTMIMMAFVWFAVGHLFTRLRMTKIPAALALLGLIAEVAETLMTKPFDRQTGQLFALVTFGGLGVMGLVCAFEMFTLRSAPPADEDAL